MKESFYNIEIEINGERYIYNSLTKAYLRIENDSIKNFDDFSEDEINILKEQGFLIEDALDEIENVEYVYNKFYYSSTSLNIILTPTLACNFGCPYCFEKGMDSIKIHKDYYDILRKYAKKYFRYYNNIEISLFGGEPLLHKKEIFRFMDFVRENQKTYNYNLSLSITTNGSLMTEEVLGLLTENNCRAIQITIDGCQRIHDQQRIYKNGDPSYQELIRKIIMVVNYIRKHNLSLKLILRLNLKDVSVEEVRKTLEEFVIEDRKYISLLFRPIYETSCYNEINSNSLQELKDFFDMGNQMGYDIVKNNYYFKTCEACGDDKFFYLMPDLTMWKCINDLNFDAAKIGYIEKDGTIKINAEKLMQWRMFSDCFKDSKCRKCKLLPDCYGGCILYNAQNKERLCKEFAMSSLPYFYECKIRD